MKIKKYFFLLVLLISHSIVGQKGQFTGTLLSENKKAIAFARIEIVEAEKSFYSDNKGFFLSPKIPYGSYTIKIVSEGFLPLEQVSNLAAPQKEVSFDFKRNNTYSFEEIAVTIKKSNSFFIRRMKAIEGDILTQGKKTEVISLETIDANKATNSSRQIFARVPGLNIWESDGSGLQIGLGGRGLNPSRNVNFNTRQNGYDISADALGYPESYYTPPSEAVEEIQMIRGAASLQFGPQFGGLINYKLKKGVRTKKAELIVRHTIGSFGLNNSFVSLSGTIGSWNYMSYGNFKFGNDWRPNSSFDAAQGHVSIRKKLSQKTSLSIEFTKMYYLAQQAGGLSLIHI